LVFLGIDAPAKHGIVGFVFVDVLQLLTEQPGCGIEPLGQQADLHQQQVPRMTVTDVGLFVSHNLTPVFAVVRFGDDNVLHPTERCNVSLLMEIEAGAIVEALHLSPLEQPEEADQGSDVAANQEKDACNIEQKEQVAPMFAQEIAERKGRSHC